MGKDAAPERFIDTAYRLTKTQDPSAVEPMIGIIAAAMRTRLRLRDVVGRWLTAAIDRRRAVGLGGSRLLVFVATPCPLPLNR